MLRASGVASETSKILLECPPRKISFSIYCDEWQCFLSTFLYKLRNAFYEQPQIGFFSKRFYRQWTCISQKFIFSIRNSRLLHRLRMDFKWIGSFCLIILIHPHQPYFFQPKYAKCKDTRCILLGNNPKDNWFSKSYC